ncbi:MAG: glycosyltransferase family 4 protein, partial [Parcubacteria group bacterium]
RPSLSEGMGNSFIEAMAAGLPVIATPVGGIVDFLEDGETGLFVEPGSPRLIAFQVQKLINDRVLHDKIIINAKRMVLERYEWDFIASEMKTRVFDKVLDENTRALN